MSQDSFNGVNQRDEFRIVDSDGQELAINPDGSINVGVTAAIEYEIKNDTGAPLPISDAGGSLTVDDGGSTISIDDNGGSITVDGTVAIEGKRPNALGFNTLSVNNTTAAGFPSIPVGTEMVLVTVVSGNANWRDDAVNPTSATLGGVPILQGTQQKFDQVDLADVRFIRRGGAGTTDIVVAYYEYA